MLPPDTDNAVSRKRSQDLFQTGSVHSDPQGTGGVSQAGVHAISSVPPMLKTILGEAVKRHSPPTFSGEPKEFPAWKSSWERFLETAFSVSGGSMPQSTLLLLLEGYLDGASKKMLRSRQKENPDLTYAEFFSWLSREMTPGPVETDKNRWKRTKLQTKGGQLTMADWRNFKAPLVECLEESNPPQDDLRDHVVQQLPQSVREFALKEEMAASRNKYLVKVRPPPSRNP